MRYFDTLQSTGGCKRKKIYSNNYEMVEITDKLNVVDYDNNSLT